MKAKKQQGRVQRGASRHHQSVPFFQKVDSLKIIFLLRRVTAVVGLIALVTASAWGLKWLSQPDTFPIERVEFRGQLNHFSVSGFEQKLLKEIKGGFFSLQIGKLKAFIEAEPWIYEVALRRNWPNGLIVDVEEQQPIASWGESQLLNRFAETFSVPDAEMPRNFPVISGVQGREKALVEDYIRYDELLAGIGLTLVSLNEDQRHNQKLQLASGTDLILGRENRDQRMLRLTEVYPGTLKDVMPSVAVLDLRYSNGFSVGWHEQKKLTQSETDKLALKW